jgi:hypothetical protein
MENQRSFTRVPLQASASLDLADGSTVVGEVEDLSVGGMRIRSLAVLDEGTVGDVTIVFGEGEDSLVIRGRGHVARLLPGAVAVAFDELDLDGYHHISRLVLYNALDTDAVDDELRGHVGLRHR